VATILIADDNSNIQKMVALAFKGEGIDVVAVGNGEAAVRKAPDLMPDLVLADIFMPVRNGYEVCEFIKQNTKLAHVPVILLAGAFDPFDEKEAQRVGADGVLKKPFVPPDPLVNLVKELLAKSEAMHLVPVAVAAETAKAPAIETTAASVAEPEAVAPRVIPPATTAFDLPPEDLPTETGPEEVRPFKDFAFRQEPEQTTNAGGASPFASMMDSGLGLRVQFPEAKSAPPVPKENETEEAPSKEFSGFTSWLSKTPAVESAASATEAPPEEKVSSLYTPGIVRPARGWDIERTSETRPEDETIVEPVDHFAATHFPSRTTPSTEHETEDSAGQDTEQEAEQFPIYRADAHAETAEVEESEIHEEPVAEAVPEDSEWIDMGSEQRGAAADVVMPAEELAAASTETSAETSLDTNSDPMPTLHSPFAMDDTQTIDAIRSSAMPWHSVPSAFREAQDAEHEESLKPEAAPAAEYLPQHFSEQYSPEKHEASEETFAQETESGVGMATDSQSTETLPAVIHSVEAESLAVPVAPTLDAAQIEDIVSRVVERMQPQVLDVITKEILRPVVEALVRKQLEQK